MNKKQVRNRKQKRLKQWAQNARRQQRERAAREALANFKIEFVSDTLKNHIAESWTEQDCLLCEHKILEMEIRCKKFASFQVKGKSSKAYFVHQAHLFEKDGATMRPQAEENMQRVFTLMAERELGDVLKI